MHGAHEVRTVSVVAQRGPDFTHEVGEVSLHDEGVRPKTFLQAGLGERLGPVLHQQLEKLKRFRREVDGQRLAPELASVGIQHEIVEADLHGRTIR